MGCVALYIFYAVIMGVLVFVYMQVEPFLMFALRRRITDEEAVQAAETADASTAEAEVNTEAAVVAEAELSDDPMSKLSDKEKEVAELICLGHSNADIADILFISVQTVKTHTKRIYLKTDVHSRMELAALINKYQSAKKQ